MDEKRDTYIPPSGGISSEQIAVAIMLLNQNVEDIKKQLSSRDHVPILDQEKRRSKKKITAQPTTLLSTIFVSDDRGVQGNDSEGVHVLEVELGLVCFHRQMKFRQVLHLFTRGLRVQGKPLQIQNGCGRDHLEALLLQNPEVVKQGKAIVCVGESKALADGTLRVPCLDSRGAFFFPSTNIWSEDMWFMGIVKPIVRSSEEHSAPLELRHLYEQTYVPFVPDDIESPKIVVPCKIDTVVACGDDTKTIKNVP